MLRWLLRRPPILAPEYGEAAVKVDESLGSVSMGLKAVPYVANTASSVARTVNNGLRFCKIQLYADLVKIHYVRKISKI